jgi:hypothetical protein
MLSMRRIAIAAAAIAVLLPLAISGGWLLAAQEVESALAAWTERQREAGVQFTHDAPEFGGFPFRVELTLPKPALASADGRRRWEGPTIRATASLWRPDQLDYEAHGRHRYRFTGEDGVAHELLLDMLAARGSLALTEDRVRTAALDAETVRITGTAPGAVVLGTLTARLTLAPERAANLKADSAALALSARAIAYAGEGSLASPADPIEALDLDLALTGPLPWGEDPGAIRRWREAGGTLELRRAALAWAGVTAAGNGTFALDDRMRPQGALAVTLDHLEPSLQKLTAQGALAPEDSDVILRLAGDLASRDEAVPGRLVLAVTAQDGRLTVRDRTFRILEPITAP